MTPLFQCDYLKINWELPLSVPFPQAKRETINSNLESTMRQKCILP